MFLQVSVCPRGGSPSRGSSPFRRGGSPSGGSPFWGGSPSGQCAGGTHPTGMHSCVFRVVCQSFCSGGGGGGDRVSRVLGFFHALVLCPFWGEGGLRVSRQGRVSEGLGYPGGRVWGG